ncbi:unnamed protein product [Brachionus calyciflorus]|uniref:AH domain-containing protein n=1 Tax=Brachionus calyciflorus TaxID=104777 RepID=A0A813M2B0_9BILA|nr:unnamed protein product [Brachionus calyciflorus]
MSQFETQFGEVAIKDVTSSLDETISNEEIQTGFSTIDLNQNIDANLSQNELDLVNRDMSPDISSPSSPQKNMSANQKSQINNGYSNININLSSILPHNLANTSMMSSASEASSKFAMKTATTFETLKQWSKSAYKCTRQIVSEKLGKSSRTVDPELEAQIENLREVKRKYEYVLSLATTLATNFQNTINTQKLLGETFAEMAQKSSELIDEFSINSETQRQLVRQGELLMNGLNHFTSSLKTLCHKTMDDTLLTIRNYEASRLEYDAYRFDLEAMKSAPQNEQKLHEISNLEQEVINFREKYESLKKDVAIKIKFLNENRVKVMKKQLVLFQNAINSYFVGNYQGLKSSMKQIDESNLSANPDDGSYKFQSFLEKQ